MRVTIISQYFPPETGAAPARAFHFARALVRAGHTVRVITGFPNHPAGVLRPEHHGLRRATETMDGIRVERVRLYATPRKTAFTRLRNHLSFARTALPVALAGEPQDLVLASVPPLFLGVSAWLAARRHGAPFVLDCRDDWPRAAVALGEMRPGAAVALLGMLAAFLQRRAACVLAVTPGMRRQFESRGLDTGRIELVTNGADTECFTPGPASGARGDELTVLYAGTHGLVHGMEALLDAAERLAPRRDIRFLLVGDGVAKAALERRAAERGLDRVEFRPSLPPDQLVAVIRDADICVATTGARAFSAETIPVKMFDYLACGRAVVGALSGDGAEVLAASGGGEVVAPGDGEALAAAILRLADDPERRAALGAAGPPWVERHYSRCAIGERVVARLEQVVRAQRGRAITPAPRGVYGAAKRAFDLCLSTLLLIALLPLLALLAIAVRIDSPGPALFLQRRSGRGSREFSMLKFRSMRVGTPDLASHLMPPGSARVTRSGRWLRRTSLDELPQLWNVLRGDMALVGPRPALHNQDDLIALRQAAGVDALRPGVSGLAQVRGRDDMPIQDKVAFDRYYLEHASAGLDFRILLRTAVTLFSSRGVN